MIKDVVVKDTGNKGKGVFALRDFARGDILFRRRYSRIVSNAELAQLSEEEQRHKDELDWETSVIMLPPGCYVNHSCDPNAIIKSAALPGNQIVPIRKSDLIARRSFMAS